MSLKYYRITKYEYYLPKGKYKIGSHSFNINSDLGGKINISSMNASLGIGYFDISEIDDNYFTKYVLFNKRTYDYFLDNFIIDELPKHVRREKIERIKTNG